MEKWKKSPLHDGLIECSTDGEIRNSDGEILDQTETIGGYMKVNINGKLTSVTTLIATTFISGFYEHPIVRHKDLNKTNNSVDNLIWKNPKDEIIITKCGSEKWKKVKGYRVSNHGNIDSKNKKTLVHRLVAMGFITGFEESSNVIHIDGNKFNNRVDNLQEIKVIKETFPFG